MIYLLSGAPGAGKGTQSDMLVARLGVKKLATGDALRECVKAKTELGIKVAKIMDRGEFVADDVLFDIVAASLDSFAGEQKSRQEAGTQEDKQAGNPQDNKLKVVLDGYPRNVNQAEALASLSDRYPVMRYVLLQIDHENSISRAMGRVICSSCRAIYHRDTNPPRQADRCDICGGKLMQRGDDVRESLAKRLIVYRDETEPLIDYYRKRGKLAEVDADRGVEQVFADIKELVLQDA